MLTDLVMFFSFTLRYAAEIESYFISAERLQKYTTLESEDQLEKENDTVKIKEGWPCDGLIEFENVTMRYRPNLDPSIKGLTFKVEPRMKIGIVGRTGAGKSSIFQTLFRLIDIEEGSIHIDGVNIQDVGLHLLRKNIAFIP